MAARVVAFVYHEVTDEPEQSGFQRESALPYKHGTKEFDLHLEEIAKASVQPTLAHMVDFESASKSVLLTFDDGGRSAMYIADRLEKMGWKGHFFVTTGLLGQGHFLDKTDVLELSSRGHAIGTHSHTHPDIFFRLSRKEMIEEWRLSMDILAQIIQTPIIMASIPGGDLNMLAMSTAASAGLQMLFTSEPTFKPWKFGDLICLGRVCPKRGSPIKAVTDLVHFKGIYKQALMRKCKQTAKKAFPMYYVKRMEKK